MEDSGHKYKGARSCLGIIRLKKRYNAKRLESACTRALAIGGYSYKSVESILKNRLDQKQLSSVAQTHITKQCHENVRGSEYYV